MIFVFLLAALLVYTLGTAATYRHLIKTSMFRFPREAMTASMVWPIFWILVGGYMLVVGFQQIIIYISGVK